MTGKKGRPPIPADQQARIPYNVRLTPAQRDAYENGADALEEPVVNEDEGRRPDEY